MRLRTIAWCGAIALLILATFSLQNQAKAQDDFTSPSGLGEPFSNYQSSVAVNFYVQEVAPYPTFDHSEIARVVVGMVRANAGIFGATENFARGNELVANDHQLYNLTATTFGGDGEVFRLPDLTGRVPVGAGQAPGSTARIVGEAFGNSLNALTTAHLPPHAHGIGQDEFGGTIFSSPSGLGLPLPNSQPSLTMNYMIVADGIFPSAQGGDMLSSPFIGQVAPMVSVDAPDGWLVADGRLLPIEPYLPLFSVIGTTYGGNGIDNFALPDLRGRAVMGASSQNPLGSEVGQEDIRLTRSQMPPHSHMLPDGTFSEVAGEGQPFDNRQPSLALNYLVALEGSFPRFDSQDDMTHHGDIVPFAGNFAPNGWAIADGRLLAVGQNAALFALLGNIYGGDGVNTFALPDLRDRVLIGTGDNLSLGGNGDPLAAVPATAHDGSCGPYVLGDNWGDNQVSLTLAQLPSHTQGIPEPTSSLALGMSLCALSTLRRRSR